MPNRKWLLIGIFPWLAFCAVPAISSNAVDSTETISTTLDLKTKPRVALALGGGGCKCAQKLEYCGY